MTPTLGVRDRIWSAIRPFRTAARRPVVRDAVWYESDGGWRLFARCVRPPPGGPARAPALLLLPHVGPGDVFEGWSLAANTRELAAAGFVVLAPDLAGRGRSWGIESWGGPEHHGDVRASLARLAADPGVDPGRIGVVSFGLGACAAAGGLAGTTPARFWIDVAGPSDRELIRGLLPDPPADDDDRAWWPREPVRWLPKIRTAYLRYQPARDPWLPGELRHAERMIRAADAAGLPYVRLNDHAPGEIPARPRWMPRGVAPAHHWLVTQLREWGGLS